MPLAVIRQLQLRPRKLPANLRHAGSQQFLIVRRESKLVDARFLTRIFLSFARPKPA